MIDLSRDLTNIVDFIRFLLRKSIWYYLLWIQNCMTYLIKENKVSANFFFLSWLTFDKSFHITFVVPNIDLILSIYFFMGCWKKGCFHLRFSTKPFYVIFFPNTDFSLLIYFFMPWWSYLKEILINGFMHMTALILC